MVWVLDEPLTPPPPLTNPAAHRPGPLTNPAQRPRPFYERGRLATGLVASASAPVLDHSSFSRPRQSKENRPQRWVSSTVRPSLRMDARRGDANDESLARFISHALTLSTPDALRLAVQSVVEVLPAAHHAHFLVLHPDEAGSGDETGSGGWLELTMSHVDSAEGGSARMPQRMPVAEGVIGWAARTGIAAVEQDASLHTAFSRGGEACAAGVRRGARVAIPYVQDRIEEHGDEICRLLLEEGGHFYVCGDGQHMRHTGQSGRSTEDPSTPTMTPTDRLSTHTARLISGDYDVVSVAGLT